MSVCVDKNKYIEIYIINRRHDGTMYLEIIFNTACIKYGNNLLDKSHRLITLIDLMVSWATNISHFANP